MNVGHGDSIIVEFVDQDHQSHYGLVDSNKRGQETPPALRFFQQRGVTHLAFLVLTHEHADHYRGMNAIMSHFGHSIGAIFTYPLDRSRARLAKLAGAYAEALEGSEDSHAFDIAEELLSILNKFVDLNEQANCWETPQGDGARLHVPELANVQITSVIPHAGVKGPFYQAIDNGRSILKADQQNDLSLALRFRYAGQEVVLGGDGTYQNWMHVRQRTSKPDGSSYGSTQAQAVKLPHHGSKIDCKPLVLDYLFDDKAVTTQSLPQKIAIISADGRKHPAPEVLRDLKDRGIHPYCTGLSTACSGSVPLPSVSSNVIEPSLVRLVAGFAEPSSRPAACQGNIALSIDSAGQMAVRPEINSLCLMR